MEKYTVLGGYDHALSEDCDAMWQKFKRDLVLENPNKKILSTWSSQDYETFDELPIVGKSSPYLIATGYNKWGNTWSYVASCVIRDILLNQENPLISILSPQRTSLFFNAKFMMENIMVAQELMKSKLKEKSFEYPQDQEGCICEMNHHEYGIFRDGEELNIVDAICPHLGCTLKFNHNEKTWDCPCHGSRFHTNGEIIKGPALSNLSFCQQTIKK